MSSTEHSRSPAIWLPPAVTLVLVVVVSVVVWSWIFFALRNGDWRWCAWMAPLVAIDLALMLRLASAPAGPARAVLATVGTAAAIALSLWMVTAIEMALVMGIRPLESAARMGPVLFGELLRHGLTGWDLAYLALSLPLAWRLAR